MVTILSEGRRFLHKSLMQLLMTGSFGEVKTSKKIVEAVEIVEFVAGVINPSYLFITQNEMIIADLGGSIGSELDSVPKMPTSLTELVVEAAHEIIDHHESSQSDTAKKKALREVLDTYQRTRDKSILASLTLDQIMEADHWVKINKERRIIPSSSITKLEIKKPSRFARGLRIEITWQITKPGQGPSESDTKYLGISAKSFGLPKSELYQAVIESLQHFFPNLTIR